jgi:hypothetical protein
MNPSRLIAIVLLTVCSSPAQTVSGRLGEKLVMWSPPDVGWWDNMPRATIPKEIIGSLRVANLPIVLEKTNLEDVKKRFGGTIGNRGDGGESLGWLCLYGSDKGGPWILWLTSGEIDGPTIGGFQWRRLSTRETPDRRCSQIPDDKGGVALPIALHLGMAEAEVQAILGRPTVMRGKTFFFCHEHQTVIRKEAFTVSNDVAIVFRDGGASAIEVAQTTGN